MTNEKNISRHSAAELRKRRDQGESRTDLVRIDALTAGEIEQAGVQQLEEDGIGGDWTKSVEVVAAANKKTVTMRLDPDLIDWFRQTGPGYQTRINAVLRAYMRHAQEGKNSSRSSL